jgi:hypothetical protein
MTGIGSIRYQAFNAARIREMTLSNQVATVDQNEALDGASRSSDMVKLASQERSRDGESVPLSVYLSRAAQFRAQLKKPKTEETPKPECPIEKARAESTTGANAPLNWLVADQFGGQADFAPSVQDLSLGSESAPEAPSAETFTTQPKVASQPESLLQDEWLLSPCA